MKKTPLLHNISHFIDSISTFYRSHSRNKVFLLGVGCQKGGTTWLHRHLVENPNVHLGFAKEYHVLDTHYLTSSVHIVEKKLRRLHEALDNGSLMNKGQYPYLLKSIDFHRNINNYYNYFDDLYRRSKKIQVVGDITPSYSILPAKAYAETRDVLEKRGFDVKVIFLMRDPVERVWSQIRMKRRDVLKHDSNHKFRRSEEEDLLATYQKDEVELRTRYENTINNLEQAFEPYQIHYEFYETLYNEDAIRRIENFLKIPHQSAKFSEKVNVSHKSDALKEETIAEIAQHYKQTYLFCDSKFPEANVSTIWENMQYI